MEILAKVFNLFFNFEAYLINSMPFLADRMGTPFILVICIGSSYV
jgi:lauroyl/myristoyl acyltransferase